MLYFYSSTTDKNKSFKDIDTSNIAGYKSFIYGGRTWSITTLPRDNFFNIHGVFIPSLVAIIFSGSTLFFIFYYYRNIREKEKINQRVKLQTKELKDNQERLDLAINGAEFGIGILQTINFTGIINTPQC